MQRVETLLLHIEETCAEEMLYSISLIILTHAKILVHLQITVTTAALMVALTVALTVELMAGLMAALTAVVLLVGTLRHAATSTLIRESAISIEFMSTCTISTEAGMDHNNLPTTIVSLSKRKLTLSGWTTMIIGVTHQEKIEKDKVKICITTGQPTQVKKTICIQPPTDQMLGTTKSMTTITSVQT